MRPTAVGDRLDTESAVGLVARTRPRAHASGAGEMWGASGRPLRIFRSGVPTVVRRAVPAGTLGGGPAGADTPGRFAPERGAAGRGVRRSATPARAAASARTRTC